MKKNAGSVANCFINSKHILPMQTILNAVRHLRNRIQGLAIGKSFSAFRMTAFILTLGFTTLAQAADLLDIYHQALENDPIFKAAYSTFMSKTETIPQARAAL